MSPIAWWNDDLAELSDDVSLEECLRQSRSAGFTGMEKGRRFPDDPDVMLPILKEADVTLCGGWFSGTLVNEDMAANKDRIQPMIDLFKAVDAPCIVYGEVGHSIQGDRSKQSFLDAVALGAFTVPGDGSLDFGKIVQKFADYGYEGWFVVEAEQDPKENPPLGMAQIGYKELMRVMTAAGYTVETQGFPNA